MGVPPPPIVLVLAGNDPTGGAGLCADIQALAYQGCHTAPVVTCITVQDTQNVIENIPLPGAQVVAQAAAVLQDLPIAACKIGLLGNVDIIEAVHYLLQKYAPQPVILDPILRAGGGQSLSTKAMRQAMIKYLFPCTYLLTPNSQEAFALTAETSLEAAARRLLEYGCQFVCITGSHQETPEVINTLYGPAGLLKAWSWPRLPQTYHGSGCTFASHAAGLLAQGQAVVTAIQTAQHDTWENLQSGYQAGTGQALPNRLWFDKNPQLLSPRGI